MVDDLEESEFFTGFDEEVFGVGLGEVYERNGREEWVGVGRTHERKLMSRH